MNSDQTALGFPLEVKDGWPPVALESLPFERTAQGHIALAAPLFVKDLSVGDVIRVTLRDDGAVGSWEHVFRSSRTTIWLLRLKQPNAIEATLSALRALGCNTVGSEELGSYAIDVPEDVAIEHIDKTLAALDEDSVGVAYPSFRHEEPSA